MGRQERERKTQEALSELREQQLESRRGSRIHQETREGRAARILALESNCGQCQSLIIRLTSIKRVKKGASSKGVGLKCRSGKSPLEFHRPHIYTPGKTPVCPSLVPFEQEE